MKHPKTTFLPSSSLVLICLILKYGHLLCEYLSIDVTNRLRQLSDTLFRRQFLFQLLILLSHLLQFSKAEKLKWATTRNRSLHMDFTLEPDDAKWVTEMAVKVYEEIRQTAPNGRGFADTVQTILDRERNWVSAYCLLVLRGILNGLFS